MVSNPPNRQAKRTRPSRRPQLNAFGLHRSKADVWYLFQDLNPTGYDFRGKNSVSGLYTNKITGDCSHAMNIYQRNRSVPKRHNKLFKRIACDPLVQAMSPLPYETKSQKIYRFESTSLMLPSLWLRTLERMSSPLYSHVLSVHDLKLSYVAKALTVTNLHPFVVHGLTEQHTEIVEELLYLAKKNDRTLILLSDVEIEGVPTSKTQLPDLLKLNDLVILPLEHIGVRVLDKYVSSQELPWTC